MPGAHNLLPPVVVVVVVAVILVVQSNNSLVYSAYWLVVAVNYLFAIREL